MATTNKVKQNGYGKFFSLFEEAMQYIKGRDEIAFAKTEEGQIVIIVNAKDLAEEVYKYVSNKMDLINLGNLAKGHKNG